MSTALSRFPAPTSPQALAPTPLLIVLLLTLGTLTAVEVKAQVDTDPPTVRIVEPQPGPTADRTPTVRVTFEETGGSGLDIATFVITADGVDISASCEFAQLQGQCESGFLADGDRVIFASIRDQAGNEGSDEVLLNVDGTSPTIAFGGVGDLIFADGFESGDVSAWDQGAPTLYSSDPAPELVINVSDLGTGVDLSTLSITVGGVDVLASCTLGPGGAVCQLDPLPEGEYEIVVTAADSLGNGGSRSATVEIDTTPPVLVATPLPAANAAGWNNSAVEVSFECSDAGSGLLGACPSPVTVDAEGSAQQVSATTRDRAGNTTTTSLSLSIDRTSPNLSAGDGAPASCPALTLGLRPVIEACFDDLVSGVDPATVRLVVDGVDRTGAATLGPDCIEWSPAEALLPGEYAYSIDASDVAGNPASASFCFELAAPSLDISIDSPAAGFLTRDDAVDVSGTVEDDAEGVVVNGVAATVSSGTFSAIGVPLREGRVVISAVASNADGRVGTDSITVERDTTKPVVRIETPRDGAVLTSLQTDVAGLVNDILVGTTINADDCSVRVNGVEARVANRSFLVPNLLLKRGRNTLVAEATDRLGNTATTSIEVEVLDRAGQKVVLLAGNNQSAEIFDELEEPLVVALENAAGDPLPGQQVTFEVSRGDGTLRAFPQEGRTVTVTTDDVGNARAFFRLGGRSGAGNNRVAVRAVGFPGEVEFCADAQPREALLITTVSGSNQRGVIDRDLPLPLAVLVTDAGGNPVDGVDVLFEVLEGGGQVGGQAGGSTSAVVTTDLDGLASLEYTLGPLPGTQNNVARATFPGMPDGAAASFVASAEAVGMASETRLSGLVIDNQDNPLPGATVHIAGTALETTTDEEGRFSLTGVPVGAILFEIDGTTTTREGLWPHLEFELTTVAGQDNSVDRPIYMVELDPDGVPADLGEDATLTLDNVPGAELTVYANSVTCPDGTTDCQVSVTQVRSERVPMEPPLGSSFMLAWTIQPSGATFDPPARLCIPNADMPIGQQVEMFSFDHDQGAFVATGTATVQPDGRQICSDPGFGVFEAGWHGCVPPPPPPTCTSSCDDGNPCTSDRCEDGACVNEPVADGAQCDDGSGCGEGVCMAGSCNLMPTMDDGAPCDDENACTMTDMCMAGACVGSDPPDCDDGNECTDDTCEPAFGCENTNNTAPCDDGDLCTEMDMCQDGACTAGEPKDCDDGEICTLDMCDSATGMCMNDPDPALEMQSCGDGSECGDSLCIMGVCESQSMAQNGMMCDDMDMCTEMDMCMDGMCVGEDVDTSSFLDDLSVTGDLKLPSSVVSHINNGIRRIPGLSGVTVKEARVGARGRVKDCCDADQGVIERGTISASATGVLTADIKGIPLWGPPTFSREFNFGVAVISVDFEVGARFDVNFRVGGEIGREFSQCEGEDCSFGSINASFDPQIRLTFDAIVCTDTIWTDPNCGGLEATPAAIRVNFRVGASFNRPCGNGFDGFVTLGRIVFRAEFKLGVPGNRRAVFEFEIFPGF